MRHRTRTTLLLLLLLIGVALIPEASAQADRLDWTARLAEMDRALAHGETTAVTAAWREAYVAAHASRDWPGMLASLAMVALALDAARRAGRDALTRRRPAA